MWTSEYERIFQVTRMPDEEAMPVSAQTDLQLNLTAAQVIASVEQKDASRLSRLRSPPSLVIREPLDWRVQLDRPGTHGEIVTIAQQCVYVGNKQFLSRRPRTIDVLTYFMDTDPDLAWGRMRFASGKVPDVTIILACTKARHDVVAAMASHPTADYYLPTYARRGECPCPGLMLIDLINQTIAYNNGLAITREKDDDQRLAQRAQCADALKELHKRRHGREQYMLRCVMQARLNEGRSKVFDAEAVKRMCVNFLTYC